jgi:hypothetical protein
MSPNCIAAIRHQINNLGISAPLTWVLMQITGCDVLIYMNNVLGSKDCCPFRGNLASTDPKKRSAAARSYFIVITLA